IKKTRFLVEGIKDIDEFSKEIQELAIKKKINGFVKLLESGNLSVVVSGNNSSIANLKDLLFKKTEIDNTIRVTEKSRKSPIKLGFALIINKSKVSKTKASSVNPKVNMEKQFTNDEISTELEYAPILINDVRKRKA